METATVSKTMRAAPAPGDFHASFIVFLISRPRFLVPVRNDCSPASRRRRFLPIKKHGMRLPIRRQWRRQSPIQGQTLADLILQWYGSRGPGQCERFLGRHDRIAELSVRGIGGRECIQIRRLIRPGQAAGPGAELDGALDVARGRTLVRRQQPGAIGQRLRQFSIETQGRVATIRRALEIAKSRRGHAEFVVGFREIGVECQNLLEMLNGLRHIAHAE